MNRRAFLGGLTASAAASRAARSAAPQRAGKRPPNIVLILADDLGYGELGCFGQRKIRTPHLDRLASEGMRWTRFYSGSPVCAPTRCCLMTGKHTGHATIRGNKEVGGWDPEDPEGQWPLPPETVTAAGLLREAGYATCAVGKWGLGGPGSTGHPLNQGFDHFYGHLCQRVAHNHYPTHLWRDHDVDVQHGNPYFSAHQKLDQPLGSDAEYYERFRGEDYAPAEMLTEAETWVREHADEPLFLYFASPIPHVALQAPDEWIERYPREWDPEPYLGQNGYLPTPRPHATYAAMVSYLDHSVGRLRTVLEEEGLGRDTLILFASDNGTTFNGGCDRAFFDSLGRLRGTKCTVYEGGIRVPAVAWWPGVVEAGSVTDHPAACWDLLPTLTEAAGTETPDGIDGVSLMPTLRGEGRQEDRRCLYWEYPEGKQQQALIAGRFKAVRSNLRENGPRTELYDLVGDPGETTDLAASHPAVTRRLERLMAEARTPSELFPIPALDGEG